MQRLLLAPLILGFLSPASANAFWWSGSPDCNSKKYSTEELSKRSKPGVVTVLTEKASGSGFVVRHVKNQTLILTNSHVIQGANKINVEWSDGNSDRAVVVLEGDASTTLNDLALLKVEGKEGKVLPIKNDQAIVGADVIAIGAPQGLSFSLTRGVISSLRNEGKIVQTDTAINQGSSGGPLINKSGCVVGVNTLAGRADKGAVNINFAISGQTAQRFIDKYDPDNPPSIYQENQSVAVNKRERERESSYINEESPVAAKEYLDRVEKIYDIPGKEKETIKLASIALEFQKSALGYFYRGYAKTESEDYQGAISDYTKAIQLDRNYEGAYNNRGISKELIDDMDGACSDWRQASRLGDQEANQWDENECD